MIMKLRCLWPVPSRELFAGLVSSVRKSFSRETYFSRSKFYSDVPWYRHVRLGSNTLGKFDKQFVKRSGRQSASIRAINSINKCTRDPRSRSINAASKIRYLRILDNEGSNSSDVSFYLRGGAHFLFLANSVIEPQVVFAVQKQAVV